MYGARILKDSISPAGVRLTTMEVTFPRMVLSEFNTHRMLSKNSASSRAIPVMKVIERVREDPFIPEHWWANEPGMSSGQELLGEDALWAEGCWRRSMESALSVVAEMTYIGASGVHKQQANRLLEPFSWHTVIVTGTEWSNFFALRTHPDAQPEIQRVARLMKEAFDASAPERLSAGEWHLPLLQEDEREAAAADPLTWVQITSGRCARVSYLTHDGVRDPQKDVELHDRLVSSGHMSPFEHVARAEEGEEWSGNFRGWTQYRKLLDNEWDYSLVLTLGDEEDNMAKEVLAS